MRTQLLSRISSPGAQSWRRTFRSYLVSGAAVVCLVAGMTASERFQNGPPSPPQASTPPVTAPDEPVAIESRKSPASVPKVTSRPANIRIDKTLVLINVTVTDPLNRFVTGLEKGHFRLFEDKIQQEITQFSSEDAPISIGLVFDTSGSMGSKLQKSRQAAA